MNKWMMAAGFLLVSSGGWAFEPVSIDEYFAKNPNERPVQPTFSGDKITKTAPSFPRVSRKKSKGINGIKDYVPDTTKSDLKNVDVLLVDRVLGRSHIEKFKVGQSKKFDKIFDVTIKGCQQTKTEFNQIVQTVNMSIVGPESAKKPKPIVLFDGDFYVQLPGYSGFEHPYYDIKPIKCYE